MRETKFKIWNEVRTKYQVYTLQELMHGYARSDGLHTSEYVDEYSGLKDKYGTEIYEGDILRYGSQYCSRKGNFVYEWGTTYFLDYIEVIGNIYINPELLED